MARGRRRGVSPLVIVVVIVGLALAIAALLKRRRHTPCREGVSVINIGPPDLSESGAAIAAASIHGTSDAVNLSKITYAGKLGTSL